MKLINISTAARSALLLTLCPLVVSLASGQTFNESQVSVTDFSTIESVERYYQTSSTGADVDSNFVFSFVSDAHARGRAQVDTTSLANGAPVLRSLADARTVTDTDTDHAFIASSLATSVTLFKSGSTVNPVGTTFSSAFAFNLDGVFLYDLIGGAPQPSSLSPFLPGDMLLMNFSLLIRPESDAIAETVPGQSITYAAEVYWDSNGFHTAETDILDGLTLGVVGTASETVQDVAADYKNYFLSGSVPFNSVVGRSYIVEMSLQTYASVMGSNPAVDKALLVDFFNSAEAGIISNDPNVTFTVIPEPSQIALAFGIPVVLIVLLRRRLPAK